MSDNRQLTLGSLFDGSGGFPLGGVLAGIAPLWASEIEPFPCALLKHHYPTVPNLGDLTKIKSPTLYTFIIYYIGVTFLQEPDQSDP